MLEESKSSFDSSVKKFMKDILWQMKQAEEENNDDLVGQLLEEMDEEVIGDDNTEMSLSSDTVACELCKEYGMTQLKAGDFKVPICCDRKACTRLGKPFESGEFFYGCTICQEFDVCVRCFSL